MCGTDAEVIYPDLYDLVPIQSGYLLEDKVGFKRLASHAEDNIAASDAKEIIGWGHAVGENLDTESATEVDPGNIHTNDPTEGSVNSC